MPGSDTLHSALGTGEIHIPYQWSYADAAARTGASGFAPGDVGKLARQLDDNSLWLLTSTTPTWVAVGGSGGGAPADARYVVATANDSLSTEIVIPSLAASADIVGAAGAGTAEEFDSASHGLTWDTVPAVADSDTTIKSHLYIEHTVAGATYYATKDWAPAGAFDARTKVSVGSDHTLSAFAQARLIVMTSDLGTGLLLSFGVNREAQRANVEAYTFSGGTPTKREGTWYAYGVNQCYLRLTRDASNNCRFYWSSNGLVWWLIAEQSHTFTAEKLGIGVYLTSGGSKAIVAVDWLRTDV
jgi:hypothetical protein